VRIGRSRGGRAPSGPPVRGLVVRNELMPTPQDGQHPLQNLAGLAQGDPPAGSLDRDADEPELRNGGRQDPVPSRQRCDPGRHPPMVPMVGPAPGHQDIDVEEESLGKSAMISRTVSRVSCGWLGSGAKTVAPVSGQRPLPGFSGATGSAPARRRRNSESVRFSRRASPRMRRASAAVTPDVSVVILSDRLARRWQGLYRGPKWIDAERTGTQSRGLEGEHTTGFLQRSRTPKGEPFSGPKSCALVASWRFCVKPFFAPFAPGGGYRLNPCASAGTRHGPSRRRSSSSQG
jgi:hypothetical protein